MSGRHDTRRRGAALFVVLLFSALLAELASSALHASLSGARAAAAFADSMRADELGRGAGDILAFHLARADAATRRGGAIEARFPDAVVVIDYLSESARVDVNLAPPALVSALLGISGGDPPEVDAITDRIARFRAEAASREKAAKQAAAPQGGAAAIAATLNAIRPSNGPPTPPLAIRDLSEVAGAWGLSDALAGRVLPSLTVLNGKAKVDPVLAGRPILAALLGGDERVDDYMERRQRGFVNKDSALDLLPVPARDFVGFEDSAAVHAVARVSVAHRFERRYDMTLDRAPNSDAAPVVVSWRKLP